VKNKTEIMHHVYEIQYISLLPKYIKSMLGVFLMCIHMHQHGSLKC